MKTKWIAVVGVVLVVVAGGYLMLKKPVKTPEGQAGLANPASVNCTRNGGTLSIKKLPDGGEYGICVFDDNRQCEEWAMMRGACPVGGVKVTGYATESAVYCAITGGMYAVVSSEPTETGICTLPGGTVCDADQYFSGTCNVQE